ncbi:MAG: phospholipase [Gammaproteobacteria bacterium]|nr:phospholipase [Gammaproteobacteria bacterium]
MSSKGAIVVLVHGWSVRETSTYGELPQRLKAEARRKGGPNIDTHNLWLSKYVSFHNEVRLEDISRALEAALHRELGDELGKRDIVMITHSTGGPVVRDWVNRYYLQPRKRVPVKSLIMLAPANFGSALAQLGRSRLARLKTWFEGVEPGLGVLDWLELGSPESLALNTDWREASQRLLKQGVYSFVLTGSSIDHAIYDHVNAYTGEMGSDGVVRVAAANLNHRHVVLHQQPPEDARAKLQPLEITSDETLDGVPMAILEGCSHSGDTKGILRSVRNRRDEHPTVMAILDCIAVGSAADYRRLAKSFAKQNAEVLEKQRIEVQDLPGPFDRTIINDPCSQLVFRLYDDHGHRVKDFELLLTANGDDPDRLPPKFFLDRQKNHRDVATLTYYLNAARMLGDEPVMDDGRELRPALPSAEGLGIQVRPYPLDGFVHYIPAILPASEEWLRGLVRPHETTIVDIYLHRVVREGTYRLSKRHDYEDFTDVEPGPPVA